MIGPGDVVMLQLYGKENRKIELVVSREGDAEGWAQRAGPVQPWQQRSAPEAAIFVLSTN